MRIYTITLMLLLSMGGNLFANSECTLISGEWDMIKECGYLSGEWDMIKECGYLSGEWDMILKCGKTIGAFKVNNPSRILNACKKVIGEYELCGLISGQWYIVKETEMDSELVTMSTDSFLYIITSNEVDCLIMRQFIMIGIGTTYYATSFEPLKGYWISHDSINSGFWYAID